MILSQFLEHDAGVVLWTGLQENVGSWLASVVRGLLARFSGQHINNTAELRPFGHSKTFTMGEFAVPSKKFLEPLSVGRSGG